MQKTWVIIEDRPEKCEYYKNYLFSSLLGEDERVYFLGKKIGSLGVTAI